MSDLDSEAEAVCRLREGDISGLATLVRLHQTRALRLAYGITGTREEAEDIVMDAFIVALDRIHQRDPARPFATWFHRIVVNRSISAVRSSRRRSRMWVLLVWTQGITRRRWFLGGLGLVVLGTVSSTTVLAAASQGWFGTQQGMGLAGSLSLWDGFEVGPPVLITYALFARALARCVRFQEGRFTPGELRARRSQAASGLSPRPLGVRLTNQTEPCHGSG